MNGVEGQLIVFFQKRMGTLNRADRSDIAAGVSAEKQDGLSMRIGSDDLVVLRIEGNRMRRS